MSNSDRNYAQERLNQCTKDFSEEYSLFFQYKSIKRFLPPMELYPKSEELLKASLFSQVKIQEKLAFETFEELNKSSNIVGIINEIFEMRLKSEILEEIGHDKNEEKWFERKMLGHFNELLKKELEEYH